MVDQDVRASHHEGPDAAKRFEATMRRALSVSKEELVKREAAYPKTRRAKKARSSK